MLKALLLFMSRQEWLKSTALRVPVMRSVARRFVAGEEIEDVLPVLRELGARGMSATVDHLGEHVAGEEEARAACDEYVDLLDRMHSLGMDANASLKLTELGLDVDVGVCRRLVERVVARAQALGSFVRLDMESSAYTQRTIDLFLELFGRHPRSVGIVIQAYLRRSEEDVRLLLEAGARIRLCKGAYDEPAQVAYPDRSEVDASFVRLTRSMLASGLYHGVATHDPAMIEATLDFARARGLRAADFEFQMLHGVRRDLQERLVRDGWRLRVYVPYGRQWYPYLMRRMAERPANLAFVLRSLVRG